LKRSEDLSLLSFSVALGARRATETRHRPAKVKTQQATSTHLGTLGSFDRFEVDRRLQGRRGLQSGRATPLKNDFSFGPFLVVVEKLGQVRSCGEVYRAAGSARLGRDVGAQDCCRHSSAADPERLERIRAAKPGHWGPLNHPSTCRHFRVVEESRLVPCAGAGARARRRPRTLAHRLRGGSAPCRAERVALRLARQIAERA
jgi:hypothetical protein